MDKVDAILDVLKHDPEADFSEVFDPGLIQELATYDEDEYAHFKVMLEAGIIMSGIKLKFSLTSLDKVVQATAQQLKLQRRNLPTTQLVKVVPTAPDAKLGLAIPGGFWVSSSGIGIIQNGGVPGVAACASPVYFAARVKNLEYGKAMLKLVALVDGEWRHKYVPASAEPEAWVKAVKDLGAMVTGEKTLAEYLSEFLALNWRQLPVEDNLPEEDLIADFKDFILDHVDRFAASPKAWGKFFQHGSDACLAVLPDVVKRFIRSHGADVVQTMAIWRSKNFVLPDSQGRTMQVVSFTGRSRRMYVFPDFVYAQTSPLVQSIGKAV